MHCFTFGASYLTAVLIQLALLYDIGSSLRITFWTVPLEKRRDQRIREGWANSWNSISVPVPGILLAPSAGKAHIIYTFLILIVCLNRWRLPHRNLRPLQSRQLQSLRPPERKMTHFWGSLVGLWPGEKRRKKVAIEFKTLYFARSKY